MKSANIPIYGTLKSAIVGGALADDYTIVGGYRTLATIADRDAITQAVRKEGMAVRVNETGIIYILGTDLTNSSWTPLDSETSVIIKTRLNTILPANSIALIGDPDIPDFEKKQAVYVVSSNEDETLLKIFGNVYLPSLPENTMFGDRIYVKEDGSLTNNIEVPGKYKQIGTILSDEYGQYVLCLSNDQTTYTLIA